jgi:hypothetical protein
MRRLLFAFGLVLALSIALVASCAPITTVPASLPASSTPSGTPTPVASPFPSSQGAPRSSGEPQRGISEAEARQIAAASECRAAGTLLEQAFYNDSSDTWWIDLAPTTPNPICHPACVVWAMERRAEVNWRCTGALPALTPATAPASTSQSPERPTGTAPAPSSTPAASTGASVEAGDAPLRSLPSQLVAAQAVILPVGIVTSPCDGIGLTLYALDGRSLGEIRTSPTCITSARLIHIAGGYQGKLDIPVVFASMENGSPGLWISSGDSLTLWTNTPEVVGIAGVPGQPLLVYATLQGADQNGALQNELFLVRLAANPPLLAMLAELDADSRALVPLAVRSGQGMPAGVWYTRRPWGIGGEIVFEPLDGLYYFSPKDGQCYEALPKNAGLAGISPDQIWVAYTLWQSSSRVLFIRSLEQGDPVRLEALPSNDRGAGAAVFSPGNRYVAWLEAKGSLSNESFHTTIRVATIAGKPVADFQEEAFYKACRLGSPITLTPVGWPDDGALLVQCRVPGKGGASAVVRVDPATGAVRYLAPGAFVGFLYP